MSDAKKCDTCGIFYEDSGEKYIKYAGKEIKTCVCFNAPREGGGVTLLDVCPSCTRNFINIWVDSKVEERDENSKH